MLRYMAILNIIRMMLFFLVTCSCLNGCKRSYSKTYLDEYPAPSVPTVFIFNRSVDDESWYYGQENDIIASANSYLDLEIGTGAFENIVIIDEGEFWYVYFSQRGCGFLEEPTRKGVRPLRFEGINAIYLRKGTLEFSMPENKNIIETGLYMFTKRIDEFNIKRVKDPVVPEQLLKRRSL